MATTLPTRFVGLDIHKAYMVAMAVDRDQNNLFGPRRVETQAIATWAKNNLTRQDAVVLEMTTNTWTVHDRLAPLVHSVTVVHPPDVALITKARVMTDKIAAHKLAQLHAANLLAKVWVPDQHTRDLRTILSKRKHLTTVKVETKNRLHSLLHKYHWTGPEDGKLFADHNRDWWLALPVTALERICIESDLDTLVFAASQIAKLEAVLAEIAANDEHMPYLIQLPGIAFMTAMMIRAAIGDITRFPTAKQLVGYSGLGARVHLSGKSAYGGKITKHGRKDLRHALVEAAQAAVRTHPHWKRIFDSMTKRMPRQKAVVAVARKLLVAVWHVLTKKEADHWADPKNIAYSLFKFAYDVGVRRLPGQPKANDFVRYWLDKLGVGQELTHVEWGTRKPKLPPSMLGATG